MILAVLDDLLFSSKIKTASAQLGIVVRFARTSADALTEMRNSVPALVIFDLDSRRTDPLATLAQMKSDPALAAIPTVAFASHVHADAIGAARAAGMDDVLPRSAFTMRLADILRNA